MRALSLFVLLAAGCSPSPSAPLDGGPLPDGPLPPAAPLFRRLVAHFDRPVGDAYVEVFIPGGAVAGQPVLARWEGWPPALRTVLGGVAEVTVASPLTTSATLTDLTFTEPPAAGSVATFGYDLVHEDGHLILRDEGRFPRRSAFAAIVALGDPGSASTLRLEVMEPTRFSSRTAWALYREGGERVPVTPSGTTIPTGTGDLWLLVANPQDLPQPSDMTGELVFSIDEIVIE